MKYLSTRDASLRKNAAEVIAQGLSRDGGLFTPEQFPVMPEGFLEKLMPMTYQQRAVEVEPVPGRLHQGRTGGLCRQGISAGGEVRYG